MKIILLCVMVFFGLLLIYYSILTVSGIYFRQKKRIRKPLHEYPSVAILIPAHNEGIVIRDTLEAMLKLSYPGQMDVYLLDDQSTDDTADIGRVFSSFFKNCHYVQVPDGNPKGKSRVLNYGLSITKSEYFIVYDADNQPNADALKLLVEVAEQTPNAAGAIGYVRTINQEKNLLTRMISIEFQVFQLLMQCGRWALFKTGSLPGTNMLLKRSVIEEVGGYDPYALAEDAELTIRITARDYLLPIVPEAETWEQEPENLKVFIKQRTRWLIGNLYLLEKLFYDPTYWRGKVLYHTGQHLLTYFFFVIMLLFSNVWFVLSLVGVDLPVLTQPLIMIWFLSYMVFSFQVIGSMIFNQNTSAINLIVGMIMYFTYSQLFLILLVRAIYFYSISRLRGKTIAWDKTKRYKEEPVQ